MTLLVSPGMKLPTHHNPVDNAGLMAEFSYHNTLALYLQKWMVVPIGTTLHIAYQKITNLIKSKK